ncbi:MULTISPECIES: hypothetical protein [Rhizobium]|uniref:hypothetical protein n=1 Tax=Rhizobium TaxID=379 RepID=UPI000B005FEF|nr:MULTISPECIES: hypothetical protein [unclassified Rhizobium]
MFGTHDGFGEVHRENSISFELVQKSYFAASLPWQARHRRMLDWRGIAETVNLDHIKRGYYSLESLNPTKIFPAGPDLSEISRRPYRFPAKP